MTVTIAICLLLLLAYVFDISAPKTRIPAVILLLLLGWCVRQMTGFLHLELPNLNPALPVLGTIGLILIVLEGSLDLELNKSKRGIIQRSSLVALIPMLIFSFGLAYLFQYLGYGSFKSCLTNAIPLGIISSAIAIPSAKSLSSKTKEFVTYETSFSDIYGVVFFNFVSLNEQFDAGTFGIFALEIIIIMVVSFVATLGLSFLLSKIKHHVKFAPIILLVVLIYAISKIYHLPALIFILLFGLFLGNIDKFKQFKIVRRMRPQVLNREVKKFTELTTELAFLIRALFFLLFGYLIETSELLNLDTLYWAAGITVSVYIIRAIHLKVAGMKFNPLLWIAPRGLITILLFLSIPAKHLIYPVNESLVTQVIILTALIMMVGIMNVDKKAIEEERKQKEEEKRKEQESEESEEDDLVG
ncbi:MAG: sodium:proton antiporter [Bacteroidetes bacterium]|nr:MAG: sodium:proton antiporter [Bacteroidota bacterium]